MDKHFVKGIECHVYKLTTSVDNTIYIGSTTTSLQERFAYHTGELENQSTGPRTSKVYKHLDRIGWNKVSITSLEKVICYSRKQLLIHEAKHMSTHWGLKYCLNTNLPFIYPCYRITTSMFKNSSTLYLATIANNYNTMKLVFKELFATTRPLQLGYQIKHPTLIKFYKVMLQLRSEITECPEIKIKLIVQDKIKLFAKQRAKIREKLQKMPAVPSLSPVLVPTNTLVKSPPTHSILSSPNGSTKRGRPPKAPPPPVPTAVPVHTVPRPRGRLKKSVQKYDVITLSEFAK